MSLRIGSKRRSKLTVIENCCEHHGGSSDARMTIPKVGVRQNTTFHESVTQIIYYWTNRSVLHWQHQHRSELAQFETMFKITIRRTLKLCKPNASHKNERVQHRTKYTKASQTRRAMRPSPDESELKMTRADKSLFVLRIQAVQIIGSMLRFNLTERKSQWGSH